MIRFSSRWLVLPAVLIAVAAVLIAEPETETGAARLQQDVPPEIAAAGRDLEARYSITSSRLNYKELLIRKLIAGDMPFAETLAEFVRVNEEEPQLVEVIRARYPGLSDEEKTALNVLDYSRGRLPAGAAGEQVWTRLEQDYAVRFGHRPVLAR